MTKDNDVKLNAINAGPATTDCMAYQCKYNTTRCRDPKEVGWGALGADYIYKSTGIFLSKEATEAIINGGTKKIFPLAPAKDNSKGVIVGVNAKEYGGSKKFVSCASCTINGLGHAVGRVGEPHRVEPVVLRPQPSFKRLN
jgi:glyceraldehyde 3-phosphate dehydrogenase